MPTLLARSLATAPPATGYAQPWHPAALPKPAPALRFAQDRTIFDEGQAATALYTVVGGVVRTCKYLSDGRRQIDAFHIAGDMFGFEAGGTYRLSAEAVSDCSLATHRQQGLAALATRDGALAQRMFTHAMHSMVRAQNHALLLGRRSALEKVASFLTDWAAHAGCGGTLVLAMTRQDIGDYLGLTIETVSRTLSLLERDGLIALPSARQVEMLEPEALAALNA